jgi:saccharopine dehydrogenase-like NADP-dependent oxidoreductase
VSNPLVSSSHDLIERPTNSLVDECNCRAEAAGITILNEIGLDPGIDHLTAMHTIDQVLDSGAKVHNTKHIVVD